MQMLFSVGKGTIVTVRNAGWLDIISDGHHGKHMRLYV